MRLSILLGADRKGALRLLCDPAEPAVVNARYKELLAQPGDLAEIQLWTSSSGLEKRKSFSAAIPLLAAPVAPPANQPPSGAGGAVEPPEKKQLEALEDEQLREVAATFEIAAGDPLDRKAVIKAILAKAK